jgi:hypothetical protein
MPRSVEGGPQGRSPGPGEVSALLVEVWRRRLASACHSEHEAPPRMRLIAHVRERDINPVTRFKVAEKKLFAYHQ